LFGRNDNLYGCDTLFITLLLGKRFGTFTITETMHQVPPQTNFGLFSFNSAHTCYHTAKVRLLTTKVLLRNWFQYSSIHLLWPLRVCKKSVRIGCLWSWVPFRCIGKKMRALELIHGASDEQYADLRNYAEELIRSNHESSVKIKCKPGLGGLIFERMHVCSNTDMKHPKASNAQANTNDVNVMVMLWIHKLPDMLVPTQFLLQMQIMQSYHLHKLPHQMCLQLWQAKQARKRLKFLLQSQAKVSLQMVQAKVYFLLKPQSKLHGVISVNTVAPCSCIQYCNCCYKQHVWINERWQACCGWGGFVCA